MLTPVTKPGAPVGFLTRALSLISILVFVPATLSAFVLHDVNVAHEDNRYRVEMRVTLEAPAEDSFAVFSDFESLPRIHKAIKKSQTAVAEDGSITLSTLLRVCVTFYCRDLQQTQNMTLRPFVKGTGAVHAQLIPEQSDFRYGQASWTFTERLENTHLHFFAEMEPDFWVPPIIGPWLIQRRLRSEAIETSAGLERLALELSANRAEKDNVK